MKTYCRTFSMPSMKETKKIISSWIINNLIPWLSKWGSIVLVMAAFIFLSGLIGNWLKNQWWILFILDLLFFLLFWLFLKKSIPIRKRNYYKKIGKLTIILTLIIFFILLVTLGLSMVKDPIFILNVVIVFLGFIIIMGIIFHSKK